MEARPLTKERGTMEGLSVGMMKSSGPSKGGGGHRGRLHSRILPDQIKDKSGPSPGVGHACYFIQTSKSYVGFNALFTPFIQLILEACL
ncbi:hypothetical protein Pyn_06257 [Prunus yedoensis var. nudiflora]|uniref:Uncharacterized protein n=1 Tax=Prunus yedoensis var. nudiflora TaxID=2094558 RepID=A0A314XEZ7_PRUYE|nr:hypothetical protein Pyn_06257 [Prunus yedoensis var. nudiflora]